MAGRIKKGDTVFVLSGKDKGKSGKVFRVFPREGQVMLEGLNLRKKHRKARKAGEKGSIIQIPMPLSLAKVMPVCPSCGKPTRIKFEIADTGGRKRICKKCGGGF